MHFDFVEEWEKYNFVQLQKLTLVKREVSRITFMIDLIFKTSTWMLLLFYVFRSIMYMVIIKRSS